ncbi:bifunctional N-acetylglucosamine-1-phosphate uridyltransferase/glucosamine-1-phosphate acetyltransferase [Aeromicrobium sp. Root236]|uniref:bifunctional UDP-N-acetylglucosamine diphosphorylase/glucosamine-1-phosphate N-acetyltransferase GlmU n=1 Tax=Aeromicrobium sp. Root236 TaxID=1736498 RepID=UPI0006F39D7A|nr:bifunctional UDP-N-acetylglucosamine diphosphorylase/glucosamine-1-phosphate N-acetyltransferase GlmU [Aeromicrobium sp. Root236]KRC66292.1 bifunctional N-acetylglucosamine-1-phosphate uridyltransferase/glucosamine-1-phosphate acetyltransferase [Aeromicrobium sp. Root236]
MSDRVTAIVLAAGAGTRMKSSRAKVLHEIAGRTMLEHALVAVAGAGVHTTVAVVGHDREQVSEAITAYDPSIIQAVQEQQNGTGHAVHVALESLDSAPDGTVIVTYADVPLLSAQTLAELLVGHRAAGHTVTILTAEVDDPTGYGRILRGPDGAVTAIREHKDASDEERAVREINSGILVVDGRFLTDAVARLETDNAQGELYLTDIIGKAVAEGRPVGAHVLEDVWQTEGVNDRAQLARLGAELNRRITAHWMAEGVTIVDPATTWIDSAVTLEPDVTVLPGTQLLGATAVARGATIGPDTTLRNIEVGAGATVVRTHGSDAVIGDEATVGPFAYLRPGTELGAGGKIGTFVEVKNSTIGEGAKVPHLTYVGDAEIGEGANIGAGTIFANYDGVNKHRSTIGKHAKTSSNNTFVAPVTVGDGAFTGAGSTIREDVPPGALAVSAGAQRNIEGWVADKRPDTASARAARAAQDHAAEETSGE